MTARFALVVGLLCAAATVSADESFWRGLLEPALEEYWREIDVGNALLADDDLLVETGSGAGAALDHFDRAVALMPDEPEGHFGRGRALRRLGQTRDAIRELRRARDLDTAGDLDWPIAFDLGIALTMGGDLRGALAEYDRALALVVVPWQRSICLSNSAETLMTLGRLREAIDRYEEAIAAAMASPMLVTKDAALANYGLAAALDRDDQRARAIETMREGWMRDPNRAEPQRDLRDDGTEVWTNLSGGSLQHQDVFFVPEHDIHYYLGLLFEARARVEVNTSLRRALLDAAANAWREFLALGGARGPWARPAQEHVRDVDRARARTRGRGRSP